MLSRGYAAPHPQRDTRKGILVTTSGYGRASFEFADGKPLELLSGSHLLYLLAEHAGIDARIEPPEDWVDPAADVEQPETLADALLSAAQQDRETAAPAPETRTTPQA
jgi:hypothetical protein